MDDTVCGYCEGTFGANAEYTAVRAGRLNATVPAESPFAEAAPSTEGSHYALGMIRRANIGPGDRLLINGATGAIGSAAVQIAKSLGAKVTTVLGPNTWLWSKFSVPAGSSTIRPQTSPRTRPSMRSERARSARAGFHVVD